MRFKAESTAVTAQMAILVVGLAEVPVPLFVVAALLVPDLQARYLIASFVVSAALGTMNIYDVRAVRARRWDRFRPNTVFVECCLGFAATGLLLLAVGPAAAAFRPILLVPMLAAGFMLDRRGILITGAVALAVLVATTWVVETDPAVVVRTAILAGSVGAVTVAIIDLLGRKALVHLAISESLAELATATARGRTWPDDLAHMAPYLAGALDVRDVDVLTRARPSDDNPDPEIKVIMRWTAAADQDVPPHLAEPGPSGASEASEASERDALTDPVRARAVIEAAREALIAGTFVRRDHLVAATARAVPFDVVVVVPDRSIHHAAADEAPMSTVASLIGGMADRVAFISGLVDDATTDALTGAANRRRLMVDLERELDRSRREGEPLTVAFLDLDHFKRFNDSYGHIAGDAMLRSFTRAVQERIRATDLLARYGGEEFCILLPNTDAHGALHLLEAVRQRTITDDYGRPLTFSTGLAVWDGAEAPLELLDRCDRALYDAKRAGRNCIRAA